MRGNPDRQEELLSLKVNFLEFHRNLSLFILILSFLSLIICYFKGYKAELIVSLLGFLIALTIFSLSSLLNNKLRKELKLLREKRKSQEEVELK